MRRLVARDPGALPDRLHLRAPSPPWLLDVPPAASAPPVARSPVAEVPASRGWRGGHSAVFGVLVLSPLPVRPARADSILSPAPVPSG